MIIFTHVIIALASVIYATYTLCIPSKAKLHISYGLILLTLLSGSYLTILTPSHMIQACVSGLIYSGVVLIMTAFAKQKLAKVVVDNNTPGQ